MGAIITRFYYETATPKIGISVGVKLMVFMDELFLLFRILILTNKNDYYIVIAWKK